MSEAYRKPPRRSTRGQRWRSPEAREIGETAFELWGAGRIPTKVMLRIEDMCVVRRDAPPPEREARKAKWI